MTTAHGTRIRYKFPEVPEDYLPQPRGEAILVQMPEIDNVSSGGIIMSDRAVDTQEFLTYFGKVVRLGPEAYKTHRPGFPCQEGPWCEVGEYVLIPHHTGQGIDVIHPETGEAVRFRLLPGSNVLAGLKHPENAETYTN